MTKPVVIASYRGPAEGSTRANEEVPKGAGGLIQVLQPWAQEHGALWVFAAEAETTPERGGGDRVHIAINDSLRHGHYDLVSNSILWPLFHGMQGWVTDGIRDPAAAETAWGHFRTVNDLFAEQIAEHAPAGATVVAHDYQLLLVPGALRQMRPDLRVAYFHHIPFASAAEFRVLPEPWRREVACSLAGCRCGFQSPRWERRYLDFCAAAGIQAVPDTFVAPVCPNLGGLLRDANSDEVVRLRRDLRNRVGERQLIARVDRADPMKNVLGGVRALDLLLTRRPSWRGEFVFAHHLVPTRTSISGYRSHLSEVLEVIRAVNEKWGDVGWQPIHVNVADRRDYGLALLTEYDVLLVNPVREGMNLVAHEGPAVNTRDGVVVLSEEAGAHDLLAPAVLGVDPSSQSDTASELARALAMPANERTARAKDLRSTLASLGGQSWHDAVVRAGIPASAQ